MARSDRSSLVYGLVLAAGLSRRLGRPKQLLELGGTPLVTHVVDRALASKLDGVVVVTGAHATLVELALLDRPVYQVFNPEFAQGQGSSLAAGVQALPQDGGAVVILLGDMPGIAPDAILAVVDRWRKDAPPAVIARYESGRGHPVLFDRSVFADLGQLTGDDGGRGVLRSLGGDVAEVAVSGTVPPADVDTEDDWTRMQADWPGTR